MHHKKITDFHHPFPNLNYEVFYWPQELSIDFLRAYVDNFAKKRNPHKQFFMIINSKTLALNVSTTEYIIMPESIFKMKLSLIKYKRNIIVTQMLMDRKKLMADFLVIEEF